MRKSVYVRSFADIRGFSGKRGWCGINATRLRNSGIEGGNESSKSLHPKKIKGEGKRERESRRGKGKSLDG